MATNPQMKVLVIDDDPDMRFVIQSQLQILNYATDEAAHLEEAKPKLQQAEESGQPFAAATVDMKYRIHASNIAEIPRGREIIRYIKTHHPYIACIMVTGSVTEIPVEEILELRDDYGMDYFLSKNRLDTLGNAMQRALARVHHPAGNVQAAPRLSPRAQQTSTLKIFISYQRESSWAHARAITNSLKEHGATNVFLDLDSINQGRFDEVIEQAIDGCDFFISILTPKTLESPWVREEIRRALILKKNIVPLLVDDFDFDALQLPEGMDKLRFMNGIKITSDTYEAAIEKLTRRFLQMGAAEEVY